MEVDDVLRQGIQGICELITEPGLINLDFADVKSIMSDSGGALMAIGRGTGETRAQDAARMAISSPLLDISMEGAKGVLLNITGGSDLALQRDQRSRRRDRPGGRPRGEHHLRRGDRSEARERGQDHGHRDGLRSSRSCASQRTPGVAAGAAELRLVARAPEPAARLSQPPTSGRDRARRSKIAIATGRPRRDQGPIRVGSIGGSAARASFDQRRRPGYSAVPARSTTLIGDAPRASVEASGTAAS